jgi:hypothetical protein
MGNSIGVTTTDGALDYIVRGYVAKFDLMKATADYESDADISGEFEK